ncbi:alginate lyase family protein [Marinilabilia salmonicolor]|uniref:alginate lyase family protein n=1 Tax=Marinilabilia salmonicolor TaxID=989 RepID=UPI00029A3B2C|nr:alginate lyase family protein [Marinilabilia salmonicolor]
MIKRSDVAGFVFLLGFFLFIGSCHQTGRNSIKNTVVKDVRDSEIERANSYLDSVPVTVTDFYCQRSAGNRHDFYSEGDYWWPDPENPDGPYIRKDGRTNPDNFSKHRLAMIRLNEIVATLTSAWLLTNDPIYADKALRHLNAWFVDSTTLMNPHMLYAQAIFGKVTGRGIGLIDAYHLVEVAQSVKVLANKGGILPEETVPIKLWFNKFLTWMTTHEYGIAEMNWKNNHGTCWAVTASSMAVLTGNQEVIELCTDRFKNVLLPDQMALNGSFPLELERTKPYGYSLFNIDAFCSLAEILSTPENNLWSYETEDGKSLKKGMDFIYPYIKDKSKWPFPKDIYIWDEWPVRHPSLLFSALAFNKKEYIDTYLNLPVYPDHPEVIRNLPVRHPVIWLLD